MINSKLGDYEKTCIECTAFDGVLLNGLDGLHQGEGEIRHQIIDGAAICLLFKISLSLDLCK